MNGETGIMKRLFLALVFIAVTGSIFAQERTASRAFYAELGGAGVILSVNMDGRFNAASHLGLGYRAGVGYSTHVVIVDSGSYQYYTYRTESFATIPFGINYLFGKPNSPHLLEAEVGGTVLTKRVSLYNYDNYYAPAGNLLGHLSVMYRRQPFDGGFVWKAGLHAIIGTGGDVHTVPSIAIGYAF